MLLGRNSGFCGVLGNDSTCEQSHCCPVHRGNTQFKTTLQSRGGCSRPQNCVAAVLKRRPTSVLPPCFSPTSTTRQSCSSRPAIFHKMSLSPDLLHRGRVRR